CLCEYDILFLVFFFQAEDGIRDFHVTGVQTCALPIYTGDVIDERRAVDDASTYSYMTAAEMGAVGEDAVIECLKKQGFDVLKSRSEERRVGKEWRCGWCADQ